MIIRMPAAFALLALIFPMCSHAISQVDQANVESFMARYERNVRVVKRVLGEGREVISCVDVSRQPAMNHPLARGSIQLEPSPQLKAMMDGPIVVGQLSKVCPAGSVEMRLPTRSQIAARGGLSNFLSKWGNGQSDRASTDQLAAPNFAGHWYAAVGAYANATASQTTINLWAPSVPTASDFSLSQMWVIGGSGATLQTVEAGVQVFPALYGNSTANFFIYFTADNYATTGCYNLLCSAFIQVSNVLPLGGPVPVSTLNGADLAGAIAWYRDPATGNWLLFLKNADGSYSMSGYYPVWLFGSGQLSRYATRLDFGGEVYQANTSTNPTVKMGSGNDPWVTWPLVGRAAYQRNLLWMNLAGAVQDLNPGYFNQTPQETGCWYEPRIFPSSNSFAAGWGSSFFFGGPGYPGRC